MSFLDGVAEIFRGKKAEAPIVPTQSLEEKRQELANLQSVASSPAGRDFRSPQTDTQDANRMRELTNQLAEIRSKKPTPPPDSGITQIPTEQPQTPVEEPQAA